MSRGELSREKLVEILNRRGRAVSAKIGVNTAKRGSIHYFADMIGDIISTILDEVGADLRAEPIYEKIKQSGRQIRIPYEIDGETIYAVIEARAKISRNIFGEIVLTSLKLQKFE